MNTQYNFLPQQYQETNIPVINHNYLSYQFSDYQEILKEIAGLIQKGDYTLGQPVEEFEANICKLTGAKYTIGVGSGTDALFLGLKALGIQGGDEVITTPYTFFATAGAIVATGARPVFVDIGLDYNLNPQLLEQAITSRTKAILPVHWSGIPCKMDSILSIARNHRLKVVEDACHAINGKYQGKSPGTFGDAGCFSLHPLKNLNVWGDGGFIITNSPEVRDKLILLRNHGLINRNECLIYGYNSRLDSLQAIVANHLLKKLDYITNARITNASFFDLELRSVPQIVIPPRDTNTKSVFHIYVIRAKNRDQLQQFLIKRGIDAKIHYPIPLHLQPASVGYGYKKGDFPVAEEICNSVLSLPVHEFITRAQQEQVVEQIKEFYQQFDYSTSLTHQSVLIPNNAVNSVNSKVQVPFVNLGIHYKKMRKELLDIFDQLSNKGAYVLTSELLEFENGFARYCGTKYAVGVANCTDALTLCLKALGIGSDDEVITAPNSFIATAGAIAAAGAKPVFIDVVNDYNINPELIESAITFRTKAIIPIHLTGRPAAMDEILCLASKHNLKVIEDAAQAVGATYRGRRVGSFGDAGCFSLHPLKNLHVHGDGGIITTNNHELYQKLLQLRNHGLKNRDECGFWGVNSRLDVIQAAIANLKLNYLDSWNQRYREIAARYRQSLSGIVVVPGDKDYEQSVYHNFIILCENRTALQTYLSEKGIETKIHYPIPIHLQLAAASLGYKEGNFPVAEYQAKHILSLPIYPELTDEQVQLVITAIKEFYSFSENKNTSNQQQ